jgi:hypothetical protein
MSFMMLIGSVVFLGMLAFIGVILGRSLLSPSRGGVARTICSVACVLATLFCVYGFMASYELSRGINGYHIGYGMSGALFLGCAIYLSLHGYRGRRRS